MASYRTIGTVTVVWGNCTKKSTLDVGQRPSAERKSKPLGFNDTLGRHNSGMFLNQCQDTSGPGVIATIIRHSAF